MVLSLFSVTGLAKSVLNTLGKPVREQWRERAQEINGVGMETHIRASKSRMAVALCVHTLLPKHFGITYQGFFWGSFEVLTYSMSFPYIKLELKSEHRIQLSLLAFKSSLNLPPMRKIRLQA